MFPNTEVKNTKTVWNKTEEIPIELIPPFSFLNRDGNDTERSESQNHRIGRHLQAHLIQPPAQCQLSLSHNLSEPAPSQNLVKSYFQLATGFFGMGQY